MAEIDHTPDRRDKEGKHAVLKVQTDLNGQIMVYNKDRSVFSAIDDPHVSGFLAEMLEIDKPMSKRFANARIGTDENGDVTFRIDSMLDEDEWPDW